MSLTYNEIIYRLSYFREKKNLSAREVGLRLAKSETYFYKVESGYIILSLPRLLQTLEILEVSPDIFFSDNYKTYSKDQEILKKYNGLSEENKITINNLLNQLR